MAEEEYDETTWQQILAEDRHYSYLRRMFTSPVFVDIPFPTDEDRQLSLLEWESARYKTKRPLRRLRVDDCRSFCWKDCAIYGHVDTPFDIDEEALFDAIYQEWFPHRAQDKNLFDGSFFAIYLQFYRQKAQSLAEIVRFHGVLSAKLRDLANEMPGTVPPSIRLVKRDDALVNNKYKMRETFFKVFIILEAEWKEKGVLLIWSNRQIAEQHECRIGGNVAAYDEALGASPENYFVVRCPLLEAMRLVVSTDPQRQEVDGVYASPLMHEKFASGKPLDATNIL